MSHEILENGCWKWLLGRTSRGYGAVYIRVKGVLKQEPAHRNYYRRIVGEIPQGMVLDHLCGNKWCVNPGHLETVSNAENTRRSKVAKINYRIAQLIRQLNETGYYRKREIAEIFGISDRQISKITLNQQWNV